MLSKQLLKPSFSTEYWVMHCHFDNMKGYIQSHDTLAMTPTGAAAFLWNLLWASAAFWVDLVWLLSVQPMVVRKEYWNYQEDLWQSNCSPQMWHNVHKPRICATGFSTCFRDLIEAIGRLWLSRLCNQMGPKEYSEIWVEQFVMRNVKMIEN